MSFDDHDGCLASTARSASPGPSTRSHAGPGRGAARRSLSHVGPVDPVPVLRHRAGSLRPRRDGQQPRQLRAQPARHVRRPAARQPRPGWGPLPARGHVRAAAPAQGRCGRPALQAGETAQPGKLSDPDLFDRGLPGFGPRGYVGLHVFDRNSPGTRASRRSRRYAAPTPSSRPARSGDSAQGAWTAAGSPAAPAARPPSPGSAERRHRGGR